jgi:hypothetical protein
MDELLSHLLDTDHPHLSGITPERLKAEGSVRLNLPEVFLPYAHGAETPGGKVQLTPAPTYFDPHEHAGPERPLHLITPPAHHFLNSTYGLLPNHRGHVFKAFGSYQVFDNFLVGANALVTSGRKYGCMGFNPNDPILNSAYGALSHYCDGKVTPRGSVFSDPWTYRLDLSARYTVPSFGLLPENGLTLRADIFNVFNTRRTVETNEFGELDSGAKNNNFRAPLAYMPPRSVRLGFDLVF